MRKPKSYQLSAVAQDHIAMHGTLPEVVSAANSVFELEVDATSRRRVDFGIHLGKGIDAWIWAGLTALQAFAGSGTVSRRTILNYAGSGWPRWLEFCLKRMVHLHRRTCDLSMSKDSLIGSGASIRSEPVPIRLTPKSNRCLSRSASMAWDPTKSRASFLSRRWPIERASAKVQLLYPMRKSFAWPMP